MIFNEPVTGLSEGSTVQYNGISVGTVQQLSLAPDDPRRVIAQTSTAELAQPQPASFTFATAAGK